LLSRTERAANQPNPTTRDDYGASKKLQAAPDRSAKSAARKDR